MKEGSLDVKLSKDQLGIIHIPTKDKQNERRTREVGTKTKSNQVTKTEKQIEAQKDQLENQS